jgi:hypothetical protein
LTLLLAIFTLLNQLNNFRAGGDFSHRPRPIILRGVYNGNI